MITPHRARHMATCPALDISANSLNSRLLSPVAGPKRRIDTMDSEFADVVSVMSRNAGAASSYLKALSNQTRLLILCHLIPGERSVTELEHLLQTRQATVSQHLARLKLDGLVKVRRKGKAAYYSIADPDALDLMRVLYRKFCAPG